jgi:hypothetical protein
MPEEHKTEVKYMATYAEWRPECACGWVGSYMKSRMSAAREAAEHVEDPHG